MDPVADGIAAPRCVSVNSSAFDDLFGAPAPSTAVSFASAEAPHAAKGDTSNGSVLDDIFGGLPVSVAALISDDTSGYSPNNNNNEEATNFHLGAIQRFESEAAAGSAALGSDGIGSEAATSFEASNFGAEAATGFAATEGFGSDAVFGSDACFGAFDSVVGVSNAGATPAVHDSVNEISAQPAVKAPVVPPLKLSFASSSQSEDPPLRTRETSSFPSLSGVSTPTKASRQDDFDSDSSDEATKKPKFKFVIKNSSQIAAAAPSAAPLVLAPTPVLSSDGTQSRSRDRRAAAEENVEKSATLETAAADSSSISRRKSVHNPAIDAQIKQYSKSQGISAAHVRVDEGVVDANQYRELEAQLIELKLSWALVRHDLFASRHRQNSPPIAVDVLEYRCACLVSSFLIKSHFSGQCGK